MAAELYYRTALERTIAAEDNHLEKIYYSS